MADNQSLATQQQRTLAKLLMDNKEKLFTASQAAIDPNVLARVVLNIFDTNPRLYSCDHGSIVRCLFNTAILQLLPDPVMQLIHFVPFKDQCTIIMGYRGVETLAYRAGVQDIRADVAYEKDEITVDYGNRDHPIVHKPYLARGRGDIVGAYNIAIMPSGVVHPEFTHIDDLEKVREFVRKKNRGELPEVWNEWGDRMYRKTAIKRGCKGLPLPDLEARKAQMLFRSIHLDDKAESGEPQGMVDDSGPILLTSVNSPTKDALGQIAATKRAESEERKQAPPAGGAPAGASGAPVEPPGPPPAAPGGSGQGDAPAPPPVEEPQPEDPPAQQESRLAGGDLFTGAPKTSSIKSWFEALPTSYTCGRNPRIGKERMSELIEDVCLKMNYPNPEESGMSKAQQIEAYTGIYERAKKEIAEAHGAK